MKTRRDTISISKITISFIALFVVAIVAYLYFLNMSVVQVVLRTEFVQQERQFSAEIATLESKYIKAQHNISSEIASLDSYNNESEKFFISREKGSFVFGN